MDGGTGASSLPQLTPPGLLKLLCQRNAYPLNFCFCFSAPTSCKNHSTTVTMRPTASHAIRTLTEDLLISPADTASLPGFRHPPLEIQGGLGNPKPPWISSTSLEFQYYPEIQGGLGIPRISAYLFLPWNSHTPWEFPYL